MKINEASGLMEYQNEKFRETINAFVKTLISSHISHNVNLDLPDNHIDCQLIILRDLNLSWLNELYVYVNYSKGEEYSNFAIAFNNDEDIQDGRLNISNGIITKGSVLLMLTDLNESIEPILLHEIHHLYDKLKFGLMYNKDTQYINEWRSRGYDVNIFNKNTNIYSLSFTEIHNFVVESMYYANMSENNAFCENFYFDIKTNIRKHINDLNANGYIDKEAIIASSSPEILDVLIYEHLICKLLNSKYSFKRQYYQIYAPWFNQAYTIKGVDNVLRYIHKKLKHLKMHLGTLYDIAHHEVHRSNLIENRKFTYWSKRRVIE